MKQVPLYSATQIHKQVVRLAHALKPIYNLHVWILMDGGFMFGADLIRKMDLEPESIHFLSVKRNYPNPRAPLLVGSYPIFPIHRTHVLVDVISETGQTLEFVKEFASTTRHLKTCVLLKRGQYQPDFVGFEVKSQKFLEGYGMRWKRHLPYIAEAP